MPDIKSRRVFSISLNVLPNSDVPPKSLKMSRFLALKIKVDDFDMKHLQT